MSDDYSKDKLVDDLGETLDDWSKKNIKGRQGAHGATPSEEDWSKDKMVDDGTGMSPTTTTSTTTTSSTSTTTSTTPPPP